MRALVLLILAAGVDLAAPGRVETFARVMERVGLTPGMLASAPDPAGALLGGVAAYAAALSVRADALCARGTSGKPLRDVEKELEDLAAVKEAVPEAQRAALSQSHDAVSFLIGLADDRELKALDARGREIRALWGAKEAEGVASANESARELPAEWRLQKPAPRSSAQGLVDDLKKDPFLARQYAGGLGIKEGYSLERHTLMVLGQFDRYLSGRLPASVDKELFRLILALHDVGKPEAVREGRPSRQHDLTGEIMARVLPRRGYDARAVALAKALTSGDFIGRYVQVGNVTRAGQEIRAAAREAKMEPAAFLEALIVLYMADAGSYTADAGGRASLDYLFVFDRARSSMAFAPRVEEKLKTLRLELAR